VRSADATAWFATRAACWADCAISRIAAPICSAPAATVSTLAETSVAATPGAGVGSLVAPC
jgi:hypothetical protein